MLSWAEEFTGVIHPVQALARICVEKEIFLYVDGSESAGKIYFRFQDMGVDMLTFSYGNISSVLVKDCDTRLKDVWSKDFSIKDFSIMAAYARNLCESMDRYSIEYSQMKEQMIGEIQKMDDQCIFVNRGGNYLYDRWCFYYVGVEAENLAFFLRDKGIAIDYLSQYLGAQENSDENQLSYGILSLKFSVDDCRERISRIWNQILSTAKEVKEFSYE